jgi:hypothetical protein
LIWTSALLDGEDQSWVYDLCHHIIISPTSALLYRSDFKTKIKQELVSAIYVQENQIQVFKAVASFLTACFVSFHGIWKSVDSLSLTYLDDSD